MASSKCGSSVRCYLLVRALTSFSRSAYGKDRVGNMARGPPGRRPQHYRRDGNPHASHVGSPAVEQSQSPVVVHEGLGARSPQLDAALQAAAAAETVEQQQAMKL
jgi:hypothetical protein